jgi:hypothetical protein
LTIELAAEAFIGQDVDGIDVFFIVGELVTLRLVDVEDVFVVTVVLQDEVELVTAAWHKPTSSVRSNAKRALIMSTLSIILIPFWWLSNTCPYILGLLHETS